MSRTKGSPYKTCSHCGREKYLSDFYKSPKHSDGHEAICIACRLAARREYYARRTRNVMRLRALSAEFPRTPESPFGLF